MLHGVDISSVFTGDFVDISCVCSEQLSESESLLESTSLTCRTSVNALCLQSASSSPIKRAKETKALGVYIDEFLSWNKHIEVISKKISSGIGAVRKLKPHVDHNTLICAYNALVLPHFDYCCEVWDTINLTLCNRLQKLQNRAARIIVGRINEHGQSELALAELNWKTLSERRAQFVASQMYKITHDVAPKRLSNIFHETPSSRHYNLRGSSTKLWLPQPTTDYLKKSLSYRGAKPGPFREIWGPGAKINLGLLPIWRCSTHIFIYRTASTYKII